MPSEFRGSALRARRSPVPRAAPCWAPRSNIRSAGCGQECPQHRYRPRLYVGEGGIDVAGILAHIPHCVYSIEVPNRERHEELGYAAHATRCLETLKAYLIKHARHFETHGASA